MAASLRSPDSSGGSSHWGRRSLMQPLVAHFVAAKRSLSAATYIQRAQEIVQTARMAIETGAAQAARTDFMRRGLREQVETLRAVRGGIDHVGGMVEREFATLVASLDEMDAQLRAMIEVLRNTPVEPSLQQPVRALPSPGQSSPSTSSSSSREQPQPAIPAPVPVRLYDFVDDAASATLTASLRACIDRYTTARGALANVAEALDTKISEIASTIAPRRIEDASPPDQPELLPDLFRALESHATEAADLLQSLVRHYDLCVTALKHTEGGGEAAAAELGFGAGEEGALAVLERSGEVAEGEHGAPHAPMTDEERADMLAVLDKDAAEVEDVVAEIRDLVSEMEPLLTSLNAACEWHASEHERLTLAARLVNALTSSKPATDPDATIINTTTTTALAATTTFKQTWHTERTSILSARAELLALSTFYDSFALAYDGLLLEIARRADAHRRMEKASRDAASKLDRLAREEAAARAAFRGEMGEFLPADIWAGLVEGPVRFEVLRVGDAVGEEEEEEDRGSGGKRGGGAGAGAGASGLPVVPEEVLAQAARRMRERG